MYVSVGLCFQPLQWIINFSTLSPKMNGMLAVRASDCNASFVWLALLLHFSTFLPQGDEMVGNFLNPGGHIFISDRSIIDVVVLQQITANKLVYVMFVFKQNKDSIVCCNMCVVHSHDLFLGPLKKPFKRNRYHWIPPQYHSVVDMIEDKYDMDFYP